MLVPACTLDIIVLAGNLHIKYVTDTKRFIEICLQISSGCKACVREGIVSPTLMQQSCQLVVGKIDRLDIIRNSVVN